MGGQQEPAVLDGQRMMGAVYNSVWLRMRPGSVEYSSAYVTGEPRLMAMDTLSRIASGDGSTTGIEVASTRGKCFVTKRYEGVRS